MPTAIRNVAAEAAPASVTTTRTASAASGRRQARTRELRESTMLSSLELRVRIRTRPVGPPAAGAAVAHAVRECAAIIPRAGRGARPPPGAASPLEAHHVRGQLERGLGVLGLLE